MEKSEHMRTRWSLLLFIGLASCRPPVGDVSLRMRDGESIHAKLLAVDSTSLYTRIESKEGFDSMAKIDRDKVLTIHRDDGSNGNAILAGSLVGGLAGGLVAGMVYHPKNETLVPDLASLILIPGCVGAGMLIGGLILSITSYSSAVDVNSDDDQGLRSLSKYPGGLPDSYRSSFDTSKRK